MTALLKNAVIFRFRLFLCLCVSIFDTNYLFISSAYSAQKCLVVRVRMIFDSFCLNSFYCLARAILFDSVCNFTKCMFYLNKIKRVDFLTVGHQICRDFSIASIKHQKARGSKERVPQVA